MRLFLFLFLWPAMLFAQDVYQFIQNENKTEIPFELINNLIILKVDINDVKLNLIFDTGIKQTILINLKPSDSLNLQHLKTKKFAGVGKDNLEIEGLSSRHNKIDLHNKIHNNDALIYIITGTDFHFSESIGININGFIGGELIKDFITKIDYRKQKIVFFKRDQFNFKTLKRTKKYHIDIINDKPYMYAYLKVHKNAPKTDSLKFLIDTGNSDALWLFNESKLKMPSTQKTIEDYFGLGFSGDIKGKRAKAELFGFDKKIKFKNVYMALPDSLYFQHIIANNPFDGLIGNEVLRRFYIWFDYKGQTLYLKKYRHDYHEPFTFNDIGLYLKYDGKIPVQVKKIVTQFNSGIVDGNTTVFKESSYVYEYQMLDRIVISYIRENSPADRAGLMPGDVLLKIDNVDVYQYRLDKLEKKFLYHKRKHLDLLIKRKGLVLPFKISSSSQL
jgi:hypothetical protein